MKSHSRITKLLAVAAVFGLVSFAAACSSDDDTSSAPETTASTETTVASGPQVFSGYVRTPPLNVADVTLPNTDGVDVNMAADANGLRLVYFGYTSCPDICPATLSYVKRALIDLDEADAARVNLTMITIDPTVDEPDALEEFLATFVDDGEAIYTRDQVLLRGAAEKFGASFKIEYNERGQRTVSHTDDLYAIDDQGTVIMAWPFGPALTGIDTDLSRLLAGERPAPDTDDSGA